jgi:hypothetical protein
MDKFLLVSIGLIFLQCVPLQAQKPAENLDEYEKTYQWRIRQDVLYGVYIPADLAEAFIELNRKIDADSKERFKSLPEEEAADRLFFSLGRWIIHNWGFYGGSRLSHYLREIGIYHPEDMARFIIITYHRNLHRNPLAVKELVEDFHAKAEQERQERLQEGDVIYEETRQRDPDDGK